MLKEYRVYLPEKQEDAIDEWRQCLKQVVEANVGDSKLVKLNIFIDSIDYSSFIYLRNAISESALSGLNGKCPAISITAHPPELPWKVAIEAGYADCTSAEIFFRSERSIPYVVLVSETGKVIWAGGLGTGLFSQDTGNAAEWAFSQMRDILHAEGMTMNNVVRQWNYIGNILEIKDGSQNYQVFNEVRSRVHRKYRQVPFYPSATGIGMKHGGVIIDFCAVSNRENSRLLPVDNPDQINPYIYGQQVLKGIPTGRKKKNRPPQFERALLFSGQGNASLFISGTASIIGQDTIGTGDVEKQTMVTIENIARLTDNTRLRHLTGDEGFNGGKMIILRVYVKRQEDFLKVRSVCNMYYPNVPAVFIESDICRDDLLVEIEAEMNITD